MTEPVVELSHVTAGYGGLNAIEDVSLSVVQGEFLALVGPNGGGKSTLLKVVLGLLEPRAGTLRVFGSSPADSRRRLGYVPQAARFDRDFPISVNDLVAQARLDGARLFARPTAADRAAVTAALEEMRIAHLARRPVAALSGGELQRALIARALAGEPELLLLDEPTASVDARMGETIYDLLVRLNDRITLVVVSHDIGFVTAHAGRVACLNRTLVCHAPGALATEALAHLYGGPVRVIDHTSGGGAH
jgi:zinc transport system ATP-binding protein